MESWEPSRHSLIDTGQPRKTCVEVAGRRTFRISNPQMNTKTKRERYKSRKTTQAKEEIKEEKIEGRERESNMGIEEERRMERNKIKVGLHYDKF